MISILPGIQWVEIQSKRQIQATFDFYRIQHMAAFAKVPQVDILKKTQNAGKSVCKQIFQTCPLVIY